MTALQKLVDIVSTSEGQGLYQDWLNSPITQQVIAAVREVAKPGALAKADPNEALYALGVSVGMNGFADFITSPAMTSKGKMVEQPDLKATYGADKILAEDK